MSQTEQNDEQIGAEPERHPTAGPPRWTIALVIAGVAVVLALFAFLHLSGALGPEAH